MLMVFGIIFFTKAYPLLGDFSEKDHDVNLKTGDMVEVMDREKPDEWLCRVQNDKGKVRSLIDSNVPRMEST